MEPFDAEVVVQGKKKRFGSRSTASSITFRLGGDGTVVAADAGPTLNLLEVAQVSFSERANTVSIVLADSEMVLKPLPGNAQNVYAQILAAAAAAQQVPEASLMHVTKSYGSEGYIFRSGESKPVFFQLRAGSLLCFRSAQECSRPSAKPMSSVGVADIASCNLLGKEKSLEGTEDGVHVSYGSGVLLEICMKSGAKRLMAVPNKEIALEWRNCLRGGGGGSVGGRGPLSGRSSGRSSSVIEEEEGAGEREGAGEEAEEDGAMMMHLMGSAGEDATSTTMEMPEAGAVSILNFDQHVRMVVVPDRRSESSPLDRRSSEAFRSPSTTRRRDLQQQQTQRKQPSMGGSSPGISTVTTRPPAKRLPSPRSTPNSPSLVMGSRSSQAVNSTTVTPPRSPRSPRLVMGRK